MYRWDPKRRPFFGRLSTFEKFLLIIQFSHDNNYNNTWCYYFQVVACVFYTLSQRTYYTLHVEFNKCAVWPSEKLQRDESFEGGSGQRDSVGITRRVIAGCSVDRNSPRE